MTKKIVRFAEDYKSGDVFDLGSYDVTREEIVEFSERYDPFPFHVDDELKLSKKMALPPPTPRVYDTINTRTMTKLCVFQQWQNSQKLVFLNLLKILFFRCSRPSRSASVIFRYTLGWVCASASTTRVRMSWIAQKRCIVPPVQRCSAKLFQKS